MSITIEPREDTSTQDNSTQQNSPQETSQDQEQVTISRADLKELQKFRAQALKENGVDKPNVVQRTLGSVSGSIAKDMQDAGNHFAQETNIGHERLMIGIKAVGSFLSKLTKPIEYLAGAVPDYFINRSKDPNLLKQDAAKLAKYGIPVATVAGLVAAPGVTLALGGVTAVTAAVGLLGYKVKKTSDKVIERYRRGKATENAEEIQKINNAQAELSNIGIEKIKNPVVKRDTNYFTDRINDAGLEFTKKRAIEVANDVNLAKGREVEALNALSNTLNEAKAEVIKGGQIIDTAGYDLMTLIKGNDAISKEVGVTLAKSGLVTIFKGFGRNLQKTSDFLFNEFNSEIDGNKGLQIGQAYRCGADVVEDITTIATKTLKDIVRVSKSEGELKARIDKFNEGLNAINAKYLSEMEKGTLSKESLTIALNKLTKIPNLKYKPANNTESKTEKAPEVEVSPEEVTSVKTAVDQDGNVVLVVPGETEQETTEETETKQDNKFNNLSDPKVRETLLNKSGKIDSETFRELGLDDNFYELEQRIAMANYLANEQLAKVNSDLQIDFMLTLNNTLSDVFEKAGDPKIFEAAFDKTRYYITQVNEIFSSKEQNHDTLSEDLERLNQVYKKEIEGLINN